MARMTALLLRTRQLCNDARLLPPEVLMATGTRTPGTSSSSSTGVSRGSKVYTSGCDDDDDDDDDGVGSPAMEDGEEEEAVQDADTALCAALQNLTLGSVGSKDSHSSQDQGKAHDTPVDNQTALDAEARLVTIDNSTKILVLAAKLKYIMVKEDNPRFVIISQWTGMLDLVQQHLEKEDISFSRLDGKMPMSQRESALAQFASDDGPCCFLLSLHAGGVGLNLTSANHVFVLDMWWNPAIEDQAYDRVHRVGQTRDVTVHRFVVEDSIEQRILKLQERKQSMAKSVLDRPVQAGAADLDTWLGTARTPAQSRVTLGLNAHDLRDLMQ